MSRSVSSGRFRILAALALLFFASGFCALIYQVLWLRMLGWVFGVTVHAASTVWAAFMAGLALGSVVAGYLAERVRRPLLWLGAIEALIGVTAFATPAVLARLQAIYATLHPSFGESPTAVTLIRLGMTFAVLLIPTVLMGSTLPLVIKASDVRRGAIGEQLGLLYGSNAAGAIAGTLAAGLYLIPVHGIRGTFGLAALVNVVAGASAIALAFRVGGGHDRQLPVQASPTLVSPLPTDPLRLPGNALVVVLGVFTLSGVISLALEVVWFRVLTLFLRPTVYGFAVMLATILGGVSLGSYLVTPLLERRARWLMLLAGLELVISIAIVLSFRPLTLLLDFSNQLAPLLRQVMPEYLVFPIAGSLLAIFPTALLMGVAFPIGLHLWAKALPAADGRAAQRIGLFYSLNVTGGIVGSLAAGFVLLPVLGSYGSLLLLAALSFVSGLLLLAYAEGAARGRAAIGAVAGVLFVLAVAYSPDPFNEFIRQRYPGRQIIWREEGVEATVVVHKSRSETSLTVNGNHEASTGGAMTYVHRRIGHLPMAIHPHARQALVIGLGGGATAGAVSIHEGVEVDVVELAGAVVRGAQFFDSINYGVLSRPNVRVRVDDGRNYLMLSPKKYDVVTADVIIPIFAGSGNLYSAEYFTLMRRALKPGGLVLQWVAGTDAEYKMIARTFLSVFPETTAWVDGGLLVGSVAPLRLRRADFEWKRQLPGHAQGLADLNIRSFDALLAAFTAGPEELRTFVGPGAILTDDKPLVEYFLSLPRDREVDLSRLRGDVRRHVVED